MRIEGILFLRALLISCLFLLRQSAVAAPANTPGVSFGWDEKLVQLEALARNKPSEVEQASLALASELVKHPDALHEVRLMHLRAYAQLRYGNADKALSLVDQAWDLAKRSDDKEGLGMLGYLRMIALENKGELEASQRAGEESARMLEAIGNDSQLSRTLSYLGTLYGRQGHYLVAIETLGKARTLGEKSGQRIYVAHSLHNLGNVYRWANRFDEAVDHLARAATEYRAIDDLGNVGKTLANLCAVQCMKGDIDGSIAAGQEAIIALRKSENREGLVAALTNLATSLNSKKRFQEALQAADEALAMQEGGINPGQKPATLESRGMALRGLGKKEEGLVVIRSALAAAQKNGDALTARELSLSLAKALAEDKHFEEAFEAHLQWAELFGKATEGEIQKHLDELEKRHRNEKQQQELQALKLKSLEQAAALERRDARQRWIITLWSCTILGLLLSAGFLIKLRRNSRLLSENYARLNLAARQLEQTQQDLVDASRKAGMAEVATGVLHDIGNALNGVNVTAGMAAEQLRSSKASGLVQVAEVLRRKEDLGHFLSTDERGRHFPEYLSELAKQLQSEQHSVMQDLTRLRTHVAHINEIVRLQQDHAKPGSDVLESLQAIDLVELAVLMCAGILDDKSIKVARKYETTFPIRSSRHKVVMILSNLLRNARQSLDEAAPTEKRLTLHLGAGPQGMVEIQIGDNGVGIAPENMTRIFSHGFTTKQHGHGFGLHFSATTARELGGSLTAFSDGIGKGATFTLSLPAERNTKV